MDGNLKNKQVAGQNGMPAIPHAPSTARLQSTAAGPQQHAALPNGIPQHSGPGIRGVAQPILPQFGVGVAAQYTPAAIQQTAAIQANQARMQQGYMLQPQQLLHPQAGLAPAGPSEAARLMLAAQAQHMMQQQRVQQQQQTPAQPAVTQSQQPTHMHHGLGVMHPGHALPVQGIAPTAVIHQQQHISNFQQQQQQQQIQQLQAAHKQAQALSQQQQAPQQQQQVPQQRYGVQSDQQVGRPPTPVGQATVGSADIAKTGQPQPAGLEGLSSYGVPAGHGQVMYQAARPAGPARPLQAQQGFKASNPAEQTVIGQPVAAGLQYARAPLPAQTPQGPPQVQGSLWLKPPGAAWPRGTTSTPTPAPVAEKTVTVEDRKLISTAKLKRLLVSTGGGGGVTPEVEGILATLAGDFVANALTLGCSAARKRKSNTLLPGDIAPCMQQMWQINVPGFSGDTIRVYKRPKPSVIHQERLLAVQRQAAGTEACTKIPDTDDATGTAQKSKAKGPKGGASISPAMKGT